LETDEDGFRSLFELEGGALDEAASEAARQADCKAVSLAKTIGVCARGQAGRDTNAGADVSAPLCAIQPRGEDDQGAEHSNNDASLERGGHCWMLDKSKLAKIDQLGMVC
jgi:hypothetical protein